MNITTNTKERQDVWYRVSDLYLDDELDEMAYACIAKSLAASSFSIQELDFIFENEVHPALYGNVLSPVGIWGVFEEERVIQLVTAVINRTLPSQNLTKPKKWWHIFLNSNKQKRPMQWAMKLVLPRWEKVRFQVTSMRSESGRNV